MAKCRNCKREMKGVVCHNCEQTNADIITHRGEMERHWGVKVPTCKRCGSELDEFLYCTNKECKNRV